MVLLSVGLASHPVCRAHVLAPVYVNDIMHMKAGTSLLLMIHIINEIQSKVLSCAQVANKHILLWQ